MVSIASAAMEVRAASASSAVLHAVAEMPHPAAALQAQTPTDTDAGVAEAVRRHLARELHDSVVQTLQLMLVEMERFKAQKFDQTAVVSEVSEYQAHTRDVLNELRHMLYELRDESMIEIGFTDRLRGLIAAFEAHTGICARISISRAWPADVPRVAANNVRRIIEEGLNNIRRHSGARLCRIALGQQDADRLLIQIRDDGVGLRWSGEADAVGVGLAGMRERVLLLGGSLGVQPALAGGTVLRAVIPRESVI